MCELCSAPSACLFTPLRGVDARCSCNPRAKTQFLEVAGHSKALPSCLLQQTSRILRQNLLGM